MQSGSATRCRCALCVVEEPTRQIPVDHQAAARHRCVASSTTSSIFFCFFGPRTRTCGRASAPTTANHVPKHLCKCAQGARGTLERCWCARAHTPLRDRSPSPRRPACVGPGQGCGSRCTVKLRFSLLSNASWLLYTSHWLWALCCGCDLYMSTLLGR